MCPFRYRKLFVLDVRWMLENTIEICDRCLCGLLLNFTLIGLVEGNTEFSGPWRI